MIQNSLKLKLESIAVLMLLNRTEHFVQLSNHFGASSGQVFQLLISTAFLNILWLNTGRYFWVYYFTFVDLQLVSCKLTNSRPRLFSMIISDNLPEIRGHFKSYIWKEHWVHNMSVMRLTICCKLQFTQLQCSALKNCKLTSLSLPTTSLHALSSL